MSRQCFSCHGDGVDEISYQYDNKPLNEKVLVSGFIEKCYTCNGTGEIDDGCYCSAYCSCECICGAWDDHTCDCWD